MKCKKTIQLLVLAASMLVASISAAKSPVFKVTKGENHLYIGGTIHLLAPTDYPLPSSFNNAFKASDRVFFESDLAQLSTPENQSEMISVMTFDNGETLKDVLDVETYTRLESFLTDRKISVDSVNHLRPAAISITLLVIEIKRLGLGDQNSGVDQFYENKAKDSDVPRSYLETANEQIGFINEFNKVDPNLVINSSIKDLNHLQKNWKVAVNAWRRGDLDATTQSMGIKDLKKQFPSIYKILLTDRNDRWMEKIKPMLESKEVEFILVGAAHLIEGNGVINQLKQEGYTIEQLD